MQLHSDWRIVKVRGHSGVLYTLFTHSGLLYTIFSHFGLLYTVYIHSIHTKCKHSIHKTQYTQNAIYTSQSIHKTQYTQVTKHSIHKTQYTQNTVTSHFDMLCILCICMYCTYRYTDTQHVKVRGHSGVLCTVYSHSGVLYTV